MHPTARVLLLLAVSVFTAAAAATPAPNAARVGAYDFGYLLGGDAPARPVQVFDDGQDTFLQFRSGAAIPAIFAMRAGVPQLLSPLAYGPYLRVPQLHGRLLLQLGAAQATAIHARGERADAPPLSVRTASGIPQPFTSSSFPAAAPLHVALRPQATAPLHEAVEDHRSYATPLEGDRVQWLDPRDPEEHAIAFARSSQTLSREARQSLWRIAQRAAPGARFVVIGRDDDSYKEHLEQARADALRDALRRAGVASERIELRTGPMQPGVRPGTWECTVLVEADEAAPAPAKPPAPMPPASARPATSAPLDIPAGGFTLSMADRTISGAVRRWAQALDYQLVWDAPEQLDAPITGEAMLPGDSLTAVLEHLLRGLQEQGYRLEVTLHANRVIRFTPAMAQPQPASRPPATAPARDTTRPLLRAGASSIS